ncbi:DNA polymerase III subunit gamma/tau C-terminal domain-containing protein, partial [Thauera linaloolentis]
EPPGGAHAAIALRAPVAAGAAPPPRTAAPAAVSSVGKGAPAVGRVADAAARPGDGPAPRVVAQESPRPEPGAGSAAGGAHGDHDVPPWEDLPPEAYAGDYAAPEAMPPGAAVEPAVRGRAAPKTLPGAPDTPPVEAEAGAQSPRPASAVSAASAPGGASGDMPALLAMGDWRGAIRALELGGLVRELAQHCEWVDFNGEELRLRLSSAHRHLLDMNRAAVERLEDMLGSATGRATRVRIDVGDIAGETPAQRDEIERRARHAEAVAALEADPFVRELIERFDATLVESSVKPL